MVTCMQGGLLLPKCPFEKYVFLGEIFTSVQGGSLLPQSPQRRELDEQCNETNSVYSYDDSIDYYDEDYNHYDSYANEAGFTPDESAIRAGMDKCPSVEHIAEVFAFQTCVLTGMGFVNEKKGWVRNKKVKKALNKLPDDFRWSNKFGDFKKGEEYWDYCKGWSTVATSSLLDAAKKCGDVYSEDELRTIKFIGARVDAAWCLSYDVLGQW